MAPVPRKAAATKKPRRFPLPKTIAGRRRLRTVFVLVGAAVLGWIVTFIAYPRSLFEKERGVPRVIGKSYSDAERALGQAGFRAKLDGEGADPEVPQGSVSWQDPPADMVLPRGTPVNLTRSSGPAAVAVPDVTEFDVEQATKIIGAAGLRVGGVDSVPSNGDPGIVVATRPNAGAGRPPGSTIDLVISRAVATIRVPNVVGLRQDDARHRLESVGLRVGGVMVKKGQRIPVGTVVEQRPRAGQMAQKDGRIELTIAEP
ncbi:MAG: PASTA domain-containing protein [Gemmatimonadota bacterium]